MGGSGLDCLPNLLPSIQIQAPLSGNMNTAIRGRANKTCENKTSALTAKTTINITTGPIKNEARVKISAPILRKYLITMIISTASPSGDASQRESWISTSGSPAFSNLTVSSKLASKIRLNSVFDVFPQVILTTWGGGPSLRSSSSKSTSLVTNTTFACRAA